MSQRDCNRAWMQRRRAERLRQGLCGECGRAPVVPERSQCAECLRRMRDRARRRRQARLAARLCIQCGAPGAEIGQLCPRCSTAKKMSRHRRELDRFRREDLLSETWEHLAQQLRRGQPVWRNEE